MAAAQLDRDILNCIYFRTVNRVTVTPVILDLNYQIYSGRRCASVGRIYIQEQEQDGSLPHHLANSTSLFLDQAFNDISLTLTTERLTTPIKGFPKMMLIARMFIW